MRLSYEFFPPRSEAGQESLTRVLDKLEQFSPEFYSVTYGAGGSTRDGTRDTVRLLRSRGVQVAPHLSIGADDQATINTMLDGYQAAGVERIVALRGDATSGLGGRKLTYNAESLVHWIRAHAPEQFHLEVAAYPEVHPDAATPQEDLEYFTAKVNAGANSAITQYFFNPGCYDNFLDRCAQAGIRIPIYPGIMPITNYEGIMRFSKSCGADVPRWIRKQLEAYQDDEAALKAFGVDVVTRLCEDLLKLGAPGLHFYTLNRWGATSSICQNLKLDERGARNAS